MHFPWFLWRHPLLAFRGLTCEEFVFDDQEDLQRFLDLNEESKEILSPGSYSANEGRILAHLHLIWGASKPFIGKYIDDYRTLNNSLIEGTRTAWLDKYTSSIYSNRDGSVSRNYELQPLPDHLRWLKTGELHYLPLEERCLLKGDWDSIPGT